MELIDRNELIVQLSSLGIQAAMGEKQHELEMINKCIRVVEEQPVVKEREND